VRVDADAYDLLATCARVWRASQGAFDPTVAPLLEARGFDRGGALGGNGAARVGFDAVELDAEQGAVRFHHPGTRLELGAIGKGYALDRAARPLREAGVDTALLHGGTSSVLALGAPPGLPGWRVAVGREPGARVVTLRDRALSVSEPGAQVAEAGGQRSGHIVDPRTSAPARGARAAVLAATATLAEAWSTALAVLGDVALLPAEIEGWVEP
jgi:thiamine biosynthesis lipoprotein